MQKLVPFMLFVAVVGCGATVDPESGSTPQPLESKTDSANANPTDDEAPCGEPSSQDDAKVPNADQEATVPPTKPAPDDCNLEIKLCYAAGGDDTKCKPLAEQCVRSGSATEGGSSEIEACLLKAKQCYIDAKDPEQCLAIEKFCTVEKPEPANGDTSGEAPSKPGTATSGPTDPGCAKKIIACLEANIEASICAMLSDTCATEAKPVDEPAPAKPPGDDKAPPSERSKPELI